MMKDRLNRVIYVGKAKDLKKRVSSYFQPSRKFQATQPKVVAMIDLIYSFETLEVRSEAEALLLEGRLIKQYKPKYNTDFVDDKRFLLVRVDSSQPMPRFTLVRFKKADDAVYFGPFAHAGMLRQTLKEIRKQTGIMLGDAKPVQLEDGRWRLYEDIRGEIFGHENIVTEEAYKERVEAGMQLLEGKSHEWLAEIKEQMKEAAANQQYERAAELRDIAKALGKTLEKTRKFERDPRALVQAGGDVEEIMKELQEQLQMRETPRRMECFDISHISGTFCVASMVHFNNARPDKSQYRRFKIKTFVGNDDFRAMHEAVGRRYLRLKNEEKPFPELVVIDGGAGQVAAALRAFLEHGLEPPMLIGLAKREETIIFCDGHEPLNLPYHNQALRLLQRLRDEAHRVANSYNAELRSKRIQETRLDDFPGLGKVRRQALLDHFRTMAKMKEATPEQLQAVEGIGPKLAEKLAVFLAEG